MSSPLHMSLSEARDALAAKKVSSVELTKLHLDAIEKHNPALNAYVHHTPEIAIAQAKASDEKRAKGDVGLLEGLPIGVKDLFCTKGVNSQSASKILTGFKPEYESTVTTKLFAEGAVMLGKTNMDEFAMGSANITSHYGNVINPWKSKTEPAKQLVPGGSSGGSSAAVAARLGYMATGTDTGGSIRQPAAFTGIVGIKPTYGRCSRWGIIAFASSLDQAGPMTRTVRDAAISLKAMSGHDPKDSTSAKLAVPDFEAVLGQGVKGLKIGIPKEYKIDGIRADIIAEWEKGEAMLKAAGAEIVPISLPHTKYALPTYYVIAPAECSSNLARYDGVRYGLRVVDDGDNLNDMYEKTRAAGFGAEVKRRILIGTYVLSAGYYDAYYKKAQRVRALIANDFKEAFKKCDLILTPTAPSDAFAIGDNQDDPVAMYLNDAFTIPASLAGLPGLALPTGLSPDGLPLGLQLIGRMFDEETVFKAAAVIESAAGFNRAPEGY
ncbi:MAG: Asp-tRNA(Asn)/Glu-tRNA(Gln) amidotransferase subunit GatA [Alphaproteobacteria bacterium]|nr:Asp-tRNA(Asn)/Glu-tRNA(Gln) amidotransferase subunit GatA [Alphaproteobacteria bacterium]